MGTAVYELLGFFIVEHALPSDSPLQRDAALLAARRALEARSRRNGEELGVELLQLKLVRVWHEELFDGSRQRELHAWSSMRAELWTALSPHEDKDLELLTAHVECAGYAA